MEQLLFLPQPESEGNYLSIHLKQTLTGNFYENGPNTVRTVTVVTINVYHTLPAFRITTYTAIVMFSANKLREEI